MNGIYAGEATLSRLSYLNENIKKKLKSTRFPQTKIPSVCVLSKAKNALPHKGGRQTFCKKPSGATVFCN